MDNTNASANIVTGSIVKYALPEDGEDSLTFVVLELRGDRVLLESCDFPTWRIKPTEVIALGDVVAL